MIPSAVAPPGATVTRARYVDHIEITLADDTIEMHIHEIQPGRRSPVAEQTWLDVIERERLAQQRIGEQINLPDREIVRGAPIRVDAMQCVVGERSRNCAFTLWGSAGGCRHTGL